MLFASRKRCNHVQEPTNGLLIAKHPLVGPEITPDVSDPHLLREPCYILSMRLRDINLKPNPKAKALFGMLFNQRHDCAVTIQETRKIGSIDFGQWLSHGVNLQKLIAEGT